MELIVLGKRSLLTSYIKKIDKNCKVFSIQNFNDIKKLNKKKNYNVIINSFYPSSKLKKNFSYQDFFDYSINYLIEFLNILKKFKINKIIYSSSSSVYNSLNSEIFVERNFNRKIYATTKITVENILTDFCSKRKVSFINARIFNMYGDREKDNFSIVSKIINSNKNKEIINLFNHGESIRDFIYAQDVAKIYFKFLKIKKKIFTTVDVGTGKGTKIIDLIKFVGLKNLNVNFYPKRINEANEVIGDTKKLNELIGKFNFFKLESFLKRFFKISKIKKLEHTKKLYYANLLQDIILDPVIVITSPKLRAKVKKIYEKEKNISKIYVIDDKRRSNEEYYEGNFISFNQFKELNTNKKILNIIITSHNLKKKDKLYYWKKYKKFSHKISFQNYSKNLNFYEIQEDLNFDDLFNRTERKIKSTINFKLKDKKILVTGGAGSIGSEICKNLLRLNIKKLIIFDNSEYQLYKIKNRLGNKLEVVLGDINDTEYLNNVIKQNKIDYIFHVAAFKHVNILEKNIQQGIKNNIFGTLSVVLTAIKNNCKLSVISTDKAAKPHSILGYTKRISEVIAKAYQDPKKPINVIRFGNVYASYGSAIPHFVDQILQDKKINITDENVKRFFMSVDEAAQLVINSINMNVDKKSIIVLEMGKQIKIINLVKKIINLLGKDKIYNKKGMINFKKLNSGEKIEELLFISKNKKILGNNVIAASEPIYKRSQVDNLIRDLLVNRNNPKKSVNIMRKFLNNEL